MSDRIENDAVARPRLPRTPRLARTPHSGRARGARPCAGRAWLLPLLLLCACTARTGVRAATLEDAARRFRTCWNASDVAGIEALYRSDDADGRIDWILAMFGWEQELPAVGEGVVEPDGDATGRTAFASADHAITATWRRAGGGWVLDGVAVSDAR